MTLTASNVFIGMTLATGITTSSISMNLTENFGRLFNDGKVEISGKRLVGEYGHAVLGMSAASMSFAFFALLYIVYTWIRSKKEKDPTKRRVHWFVKLYWVVFVLGLIITLTTSILNIVILEHFDQYFTNGSIKISPTRAQLIPGRLGDKDNLRGSFGTAMMGMNATMVGLLGSALIMYVSATVVNAEKQKSDLPYQYETLDFNLP